MQRHSLHLGKNGLVTGFLYFLGCPLSPKILLSNVKYCWVIRCNWWLHMFMVRSVVIGWLITSRKWGLCIVQIHVTFFVQPNVL